MLATAQRCTTDERVILLLVSSKVVGLRYVSLASCIRYFFFCQQALALEGSYASGSSRGDSLLVPLILDVSSCEDTLDGGHRGARLSDNVAVVVALDLIADKASRWLVADCVKETVHLQIPLLASLGVLDGEVRKQIL